MSIVCSHQQIFFLMIQRPPISTRTNTLFPYKTLVRSFYRAMAVLVAASPCALAIATPSAVLSGVARAARGGVLIKGGGPLEMLGRSEEHTSELQSLMRTSYAVFCLKKKKRNTSKHQHRLSHIRAHSRIDNNDNQR